MTSLPANGSSGTAAASSRTLAAKLRWVAYLYLAEGLPFGMVIKTLPLYFKDSGTPNETIGLLSMLALPWSLKFLWSPLVDVWPRYRRWIALCLPACGMLLACLPWFPADHIAPSLWVVLFLLAIAGATNDIAIDAYTIRLVDAGEEGPVNGVRITAYRVALILSGAVLLSQKTALGYATLLRIVGAGLISLGACAWLLPRTGESWEARRDRIPEILTGVGQWLMRPGTLGVVFFILLYNLGDITIGPMIPPFWRDRGYEVEEIGWISMGLGVGLTIAGALAGGVIVSRIGIFHGLWTLGLTQGLSNLGYAGAAYWEWGRPGMYAASAIESFTDGLGSAALLAFLMRLCDKDLAATEYAALSGLFALARVLFGSWSGFAVVAMGYGNWFLTTFLLSFPMFAFLPAVRARLAASPAGERER